MAGPHPRVGFRSSQWGCESASLSVRMGTPVENHCSKGCRARAGDLGLGGGRGRGRRAFPCPGWGSGSLVQRMFDTLPPGCFATQEGSLTTAQVMSKLLPTWSRVTVPTHSFSSWKGRLQVKLETLGHNLPATPHLIPGTTILSPKPLVSSLRSILLLLQPQGSPHSP